MGVSDLGSYDRDIAEIKRRIQNQQAKIGKLEIEVLKNFDTSRLAPN